MRDLWAIKRHGPVRLFTGQITPGFGARTSHALGYNAKISSTFPQLMRSISKSSGDSIAGTSV